MENTKNLGIVSPVPMGDWNASTTYNFLNVVNHNKSTYLAKLQNVQIEPGVNGNWATYWMLLSPSYEEIVSAFTDDLNTAIENYEQILGVKFDDLETQLTEEWTEKSNALTEQFNDLEQSVTEQVTKNTNEIKALFGLNITKGVLAYDNATSTAEVQQTGGAELAGLNILDGSYATVNKIQGKTVKSANLINVDEMLNADLVKNTDGSYTFTKRTTNAPNYSEWFNCNIPTGEYYFTCDIVSKTITGEHVTAVYEMANGEQVYVSAESGVVALAPTDTIVKIRLYLTSTIAVDEYITFKNLMLSSENIPYRPYFDGLKSAQISGIKSVSNLLKWKGRTQKTSRIFDESEYWTRYSANNTLAGYDTSTATINDNSITVNVNTGYYGIGFPVKCLPNTVYTISAKSVAADGVKVLFSASFYDKDGVYISYARNDDKPAEPKTFTTPSNAAWSVIGFTSTTSSTIIEISDIMLNYGSTALPYREYEESIMQLPETVELGEWDSIDGKTLTKGTEILTITGDENWISAGVNNAGTGAIFYAQLPSSKRYVVDDIVSSMFEQDTGNAGWEAYDANSINLSNYRQLVVVTGNPNQTLEEWKAYLKGLYNAGTPLVVALHKATPTTSELDFNNYYLAWDKGQETVLTPTDESGNTCFDYGANTTTETDYLIIVGGNE